MSSSAGKAKLYFCYDGEWEQDNNEWNFAYKSKHGVKVSVNYTYQKFLAYAMQKCGINPSAVCKLVFKNGNGLFVDLSNDGDISTFLHFAADSESPPLLFVYPGVSDEHDDDGDDEDLQIEQPDSQFQASDAPTVHLDHSYGLNDSIPETQQQQPQQQPQEGRWAGVANDETYVFNTGNADIDRSDTDNDDHEEYTPSRKSGSQINDFFDMPPTLPDSHTQTQTYEPTPYIRSERLKAGQTFDSKDILASQIGLKFLEEGFRSHTLKSDKTKYVVQCAREKCEWRLYAIHVGPKGGAFMIRSLHDVHTCTRTQLNPQNKQAGKKTLGSMMKKKFLDVSRSLRPKDIVHDVHQQFGVTIGYHQAWRARCQALLMVRGTFEESYERLPTYLYNLQLQNLGTVIGLRTDSHQRFEKCFVALGPAIRTFLGYLRRVLIIDAAHLKGRSLGVMFLAVAMDGDNSIVPLAFGVGKSETGDEWTWFLSKLREAIGEPDGLVFMSDRAPSISAAISAIYPNAPHAICCRHLEMNAKTKDKRITTYKDVYWAACRAYTDREFNRYMNLLRVSAKEAAKVMDEAGPERFSAAHFPGQRYDILTSNSAESVNALSRFARRCPIINLLDYFRAFQQEWYQIRRRKGAAMQNALTPTAEEIVQYRARRSATWPVREIGYGKYEVHDENIHAVVNMEDHICSCLEWDKSGLPCGHAIAAATYMGRTDCSDLAVPFFTSEYYRKTYVDVINPTGPPAAWVYPPNPLPPCYPPLMDKNKAGRPKKHNRRPSRGEGPIQRICTRCQCVGHTRGECPNPAPSTVPRRHSVSHTPGPSQLEPYGTNTYDTVDLNADL